jgi:hypothetical protein
LKEFATFLSKKIIGRPLVLLIICLTLISNTQGQTIEKQLCGHAWQQRPIANIIWNFQENGEFMAMYISVSKETKKISLSGFILKKGTFTVNDSTKTITINFDSTYTVFSNDSSTVSKDTAKQEWHLISVTNRKIVFSRPPVWDFEKEGNQNEDKNLIVTMDGGKKKQKDTKSKQ